MFGLTTRKKESDHFTQEENGKSYNIEVEKKFGIERSLEAPFISFHNDLSAEQVFAAAVPSDRVEQQPQPDHLAAVVRLDHPVPVRNYNCQAEASCVLLGRWGYHRPVEVDGAGEDVLRTT